MPSPRSFYNFEPSTSALLTIPELRAPVLGPSAFAVWLWLRVERGSDAQTAFALHGGGLSLEIVVLEGDVLCVRVTGSKGGASSLYMVAPLTIGQWHVVMLDLSAAARRLLPFARSSGGGMLRVYLDGMLSLTVQNFDFPTPTASLRHCHVGSRGAEDRLHGGLAEVLVLPCLTGTAGAASAWSALRLEPRLSMEEAARRAGLRPTLALNPQSLTLHGAGLATPSTQLGAALAAAAPDASAAASGVRVRVHTQIDTRDTLVGLGGVRLPLILIAMRCPPLAGAAAGASAASTSALATAAADGVADGVADLVRLLRALLWRRPAMHVQLSLYDGPSVLGWLLLRLPGSMLTCALLQQLDGLVDDLVAADDDPTLVGAAWTARERPQLAAATVELCCLVDFRVWARAPVDVQCAHLRLLRRRKLFAGSGAFSAAPSANAPTQSLLATPPRVPSCASVTSDTSSLSLSSLASTAPPPSGATAGASAPTAAFALNVPATPPTGGTTAAASAAPAVGLPPRLTARHVIDALRTLYSYRSSALADKRLRVHEYHTLRLEAAALAGVLVPTTDDVHAVVTRLAEGRDLSLRVALMHVLRAWLQQPPPADHSDPTRSPAQSGNASRVGSVGASPDSSHPHYAVAGGPPVPRGGITRKASRALFTTGGVVRPDLQPAGFGRSDGGSAQATARASGSNMPHSPAVAQRVLAILSERGAVNVLLPQLLPSSSELRQVTLDTLATFLRGSPPALADVVEERLAEMLPGWAMAEGRTSLRAGVIAAMLRLSASPSDPTRLHRPRLPLALVAVLPHAPPACQCAVLTAIAAFLDAPGGSAHHSATLLLSDEMLVHRIVEVLKSVLVGGGSDGGDTPAGAERGGRVNATVGACVNFGEVHVSLVLQCTRAPPVDVTDSRRDNANGVHAPASAAAAHEGSSASHDDEEETSASTPQHAADLALRLLATLLRHALELRDGWRILPLTHALLATRLAPAMTAHIVWVLCCRTIAILEQPLVTGNLPPVGSAATSSSGVLPPIVPPTVAGGGVSHPPEWTSAWSEPSGEHGGAASPFWPNLVQYLLCIDTLLLRSDKVWQPPMQEAAFDDRRFGYLPILVQNMHLKTEGGVLSERAAAHMISTLVCLTQKLSTPLRAGDTSERGAARSAPPRAPLTHLTSDASTFRTLVQWVVTAIRDGWARGLRSLDGAPLALPVQMLLRLTSPLSLPHAAATLILATAVTLDEGRADEASALIARFISAAGPGGDRWSELLPGASSGPATFLHTEHARRAYDETRIEAAGEANERAATMRGIVDDLVARLGETCPDMESVRRTSFSEAHSGTLPLPMSGISTAAAGDAAAPPSVSAWLSECERRAERSWRKLIRSLAHESHLGVDQLLSLDAATVCNLPSGLELAADGALAERWRLDPWEGPQLPAGMVGVAGNGRMRLKLRRDFAPNSHRLAAHESQREAHAVAAKAAPPAVQVSNAQAEAASDDEADDDGKEGVEGGAEAQEGAGQLDDGGGIEEERPGDDGAAAARLHGAGDGSERVLLSAACHLVRGMGKQAGTLLISHPPLPYHPLVTRGAPMTRGRYAAHQSELHSFRANGQRAGL